MFRYPSIPHGTNYSISSKTYTFSKGGITANARLGSDMVYHQNGKNYLLITLKGDPIHLPIQESRLPLNLSLVIDRSGSMSGTKLENVKTALYQISHMLNERDLVSIVIYDDSVDTIYNGQYNENRFLSAISEIDSRGSTYLEGGLKEGLKNINAHYFLGGHYINKLILLSDGLANVGVSSPYELARLVQDYSEQEIHVSTIGIGADYDENLMTQVALAGRGNYYFMENGSDAEQILTQEFQGMVNTIAEDVKVEFNFDDQFILNRAVGYKLDNQLFFTPQNISSGKETSYLFEIQSKDLRMLNTNKASIANLKITFNSIVSKSREEINIPVQVDITSNAINPLSDDRVYKEYMNANVAEKLWKVDEHLNNVQNSSAQTVMSELRNELNSANQRLPGVFDKELSNLKTKQDYLNKQGSADIKTSVSGRLFKKSNQAESYMRQYNK